MKKELLRALESITPPSPVLINHYKRRDVFRCGHEAHRRFNSTVSVYHVLKVKKCFPNGCIYFQWRCRKLGKGQPCPRKFKHVGKACASCPHFYDIKVIRRPEIILSVESYSRFLRDFRAFESWIKEHEGRQISYSGIVNSVKPRYRLVIRQRKTAIIFTGFLLNFREGFINTSPFKDFVYVPVTNTQQKRLRFSRGDSLQFTGTFTVRNGMILIEHVRSIEILQRGEPCFWTESRARVAQRTGSLLPFQAIQCYFCDKGVLLEVSDEQYPSSVRRKMFCLEGITDPRWCYYKAQRFLRVDECDDQKVQE